jgi:hypothetical protein
MLRQFLTVPRAFPLKPTRLTGYRVPDKRPPVCSQAAFQIIVLIARVANRVVLQGSSFAIVVGVSVLACADRMASVIRVFAIPAERSIIRVIEHRDRCELIIRSEDGGCRRHSLEPGVARALIDSLHYSGVARWPAKKSSPARATLG